MKTLHNNKVLIEKGKKTKKETLATKKVIDSVAEELVIDSTLELKEAIEKKASKTLIVWQETDIKSKQVKV